METSDSYHIWINAGYEIFAREGPEGIQVERLARITNHNKSGYYHYFGDRDTYILQLTKHHLEILNSFISELKEINRIDPDYLELLIKYGTPMMFTNQLIHNRHDKSFLDTLNKLYGEIDPIVSKLFAEFIGFKDHVEFSAKYFSQVRLMFHSQITFKNINYPYLRSFIYQAKDVIQNAIELAQEDNKEKSR